MALGGFNYQTVIVGPVAIDVAGWTAVFEAILASFHSLTGWSSHTAATMYYSFSGNYNFYAISKYGAAGDNGYIVWVYVTGGNGATSSIAATNMINGAAYIATSEKLLGVYLPPGTAVPGAGDPRTVSWLPGAFRFQVFTDTVETNGSDQVRYHFMGRDASIVIAVESAAQTSTLIDSLILIGEVLEVPANDPTDTNRFAMITFAGLAGIPASVNYIQFLTAAGAKVVGTITHEAASLAVGVNDRSPWNWSRVLAYISSSDLDTNGPVPGNGTKGYVNPEFLRKVRSGIVTNKQQFASGNLIYLANGYVVGWDTAIGAMT